MNVKALKILIVLFVLALVAGSFIFFFSCFKCSRGREVGAEFMLHSEPVSCEEVIFQDAIVQVKDCESVDSPIARSTPSTVKLIEGANN